MGAAILPTDSNNNAVQCMGFADGGAQDVTLASGGTAVKNTTAFADDTAIVTFTATIPVRFKQGDNSVTAAATDHYWPANIPCDVSTGGKGKKRKTYISFKAADGNSAGTVYLSERE